MFTNSSSVQLFFVILGIALLSHVAGHSYMTSPISRSNQAQSNTGCRGPQCLGPCDIPLSAAKRAPIVATRGESFRVNWPRNNHAGGFIRFAWAPTAQSDNHAAFDSHVQLITCHEIGNPVAGQCAPADPKNDPNGGGSGPGDGSFGACNTNLSIPLDLTDGMWTLQWAWFGGAFSLGDYYSCADYQIVGGPTGKLTPAFVGGDFSYPNQNKCKFFNTDKLHVCINEPCDAPLYAAARAQSGMPAAGQLGSGVPIVSTPLPAPTPVTPTPAPTPVTPAPTPVTPAPTPVTPAPVPVPVTPVPVNPPASLTTAAPVQVPAPVTPTPAPVPTPVTPVPAPVPTPVTPTPTPDSSPCTPGYMKRVTSETYSMCDRGRWAVAQSCQRGLTCSPSGNYIYCV